MYEKMVPAVLNHPGCCAKGHSAYGLLFNVLLIVPSLFFTLDDKTRYPLREIFLLILISTQPDWCQQELIRGRYFYTLNFNPEI